MSRRFEQQTTDMVIGRGVIMLKGMWLLGQRRLDKKNNPGRWEHLGGTIELDKESILEGTIREIREESGLEVEPVPGFEDGVIVEQRPLSDCVAAKPGLMRTVWAFRMMYVGGKLFEPGTFPEHNPVRLMRPYDLRLVPQTAATERSFEIEELTSNLQLAAVS